jgi:hypothetical protein
MKYRVLWSPEAELQLEAIVAAADDRGRIGSAVQTIDRSLSIDPTGFGESRSGSIRIGFARPLGVQYDLLKDVATVVVEDVWRTDRKRGE